MFQVKFNHWTLSIWLMTLQSDFQSGVLPSSLLGPVLFSFTPASSLSVIRSSIPTDFQFWMLFNAIRYVGWRWTFLFLVYLYTILKNHTAHACEGDTLTIECPPRTSVTVLSAFYGRRVPHQYLCPSVNSNATAEEDAECVSPVAIEVSVK